ncbi:glycoside hydrolase family protein [Sabulicella glaciei]|uniref:Glycosyl hydrolase family 32 N-terminal domain-containing protein n=1 Tax=Sabulicella glaciei TaxID=2984948 RepID=A0ABT3NZA8_9PROT|nr:hypothetical protein [Roseococcus sp. MDT2-1-1]MCW8087498.1 hypothetical protein [Roseococcus sp. MDT2-1-1]
MKWRKLGCLWKPDGNIPWARTHAMLPTPAWLPDGRLRLFLASCDEATVSRVGWIDLDGRDPTRIVGQAKEPVLDIGSAGCFDDNGVNPSCIIQLPDGTTRLYYVGYQKQVKVPYTLFTGAAEAPGPESSFVRAQDVPVMDRGPGERFFRTAALVQPGLDDEGVWDAWYIGGGDFTVSAGREQPKYSLRRATSADGLIWPSWGQPVLQPEDGELGFGRPWLHRLDSDRWTLWYSIRTASGYRLGYAVSHDGRSWIRRDDLSGLESTGGDWDGEMQCYGVVQEVGGNLYMFYNGNGYGRTGVGLAVLECD